MDSNGSPVSPRRSSCAKTSPMRAFAPGPPPVPVIVHERADAGPDARAALELDDVLDVPERPQDEDVRGLGRSRRLRRSSVAPAGDAAFDGSARPSPSSQSIASSAVRLDEGVGDGMDKIAIRHHVALPCETRVRMAPIALSEVLRSALRPLARLGTTTLRVYAARCSTRTLRYRRWSSNKNERCPNAAHACTCRPNRARGLRRRHTNGREGTRPVD